MTQTSENKAWMPRQVSNAISKGACDEFNTRRRNHHPKANKLTGIVGDKTGTFTIEKRFQKIKAV